MNHIKEKGKKIGILHIANSLWVSGADMALYHYIKALGTERYDHYVYFLGVDGYVRNKIEALGVPVLKGGKRGVISNPFKFFSRSIALILDLMVFIKKKDIQIILSQTGFPNQLAVIAAKLMGKPVFPTIHSTMAFVDNRKRSDPRVYLNWVINRICYRTADSVLAVSPEIKEIICQNQKLKSSRVIVLKNGIVFDTNCIQPVDLEMEFPESKSKLKLIAVGRLVPLKGFDILVRAIAECVEKGMKDIFLVIAGRGEERFRLEKLIRELDIINYVKLLGLRQDVVGLMKNSDVFIMPSLYEGLSIAMIEAMACGLPIIASAAPGLRDYVKTHQNGILFPIGNHKALADSILQLAIDKKLVALLSRGARECYEREYDMQKNIKTLDVLFRKYAETNYEGPLGNSKT